MTPFEWLQAVASAATAVGVGVAAVQLWTTRQQAQSAFEDSLDAQYRKISSGMPLEALLGKKLEDARVTESLRAFYEYFDLSNEQAFLHARKRLRKATWLNWKEGIEQNLARPAFQRAWQILAPDLDGSFSELRQLIPVALRENSDEGTKAGTKAAD